jgi:hypothetical protein
MNTHTHINECGKFEVSTIINPERWEEGNWMGVQGICKETGKHMKINCRESEILSGESRFIGIFC